MACIESSEISAEFLESFSKVDNLSDQKILVRKYIQQFKTKTKKVSDFKTGLEWVNVIEPLSFGKQLRGKIVVLDFFTYCCINCIHILPDLKALEDVFSVEHGLVIIGVHSPKFMNERSTMNVEAAVKRYEITHPVVNDANETMWTELEICCWPTVCIIGPNGELLLMLMGEGHGKLMKLFVSEALSLFKEENSISNHPLPEISHNERVDALHVLRYPGKITVLNNPDNVLLAVADTGNHRILIMSESGAIMKVFGGHGAGFDDGSEIGHAKFHSPQGLVFKDKHTLFVADTENHAIRKIDLLNDKVSTIVGNGRQGNDKQGGKPGPLQEISSPWDLCIANDKILIISMAGTHQIWALFLEDTSWWQNKKFTAGTCVAIAGSGREENRNNAYPMSAGFAQPSGVTFKSESCIFIADSESSSIRCLNLADGKVTGVVGGHPDPTNLFAFGDEDGVGNKAKLQHPLGVTWSDHKKLLYAADSYNHKIRVIDTVSKSCTTLKLSCVLNEPGGMCVYKDKLYIANTNNHAIHVVNLDSLDTIILQIEMNEKEDIPKNNMLVVKDMKLPIHSNGGSLVVNTAFVLPANTYLTEGAPSKWTLILPGADWVTEKGDNHFEDNKHWTIKVPSSSDNQKIVIQCKLFLCKNNVCTVSSFCFIVELYFVDNADPLVSASFSYSL